MQLLHLALRRPATPWTVPSLVSDSPAKLTRVAFESLDYRYIGGVDVHNWGYSVVPLRPGFDFARVMVEHTVEAQVLAARRLLKELRHRFWAAPDENIAVFASVLD